MANPLRIPAFEGGVPGALVWKPYIPYIPNMSAPIHTRTFKSGNSVAVRLPRGLAIAADVEVVLEQRGDEIVLRPVKDPVAEKQKLLAILADLKALGPVGEIEKREPFDFPDRPGL